MAEDPIPADVHAFIVTNIDSIAYLEALLQLRADRAMTWTAAAVATRLYISEAEAGGILSRLSDNRFAASERSAFRYDCDADVDAMVGRLAEIYSKHLIPVTNLIHSRPGRIRAFASAFKLRKES